jgi:F-type H+-transporting ATPase subunit b
MRVARLTLAAAFALAFPVAASAQTEGTAAEPTPAPAAEADKAAAAPAPTEAQPDSPTEAKPGEAGHAAEAKGAHPSAEHTGGGEHAAGGEHGEAHHEPAHGIVNWWSWDYGPKAKDPTHRGWPAPFGFMLINFVIFLGILSRLLFKPLKNMAASRHEEIRRNLDAASKLRAEAEAKLREYEDKVKNVDAEIDALVTQLRSEAEAEKARIIANAEAEAQRLRADAQKQIDSEMARIRAELKAQLVDSVVGIAEQILTKNIGADDQRKMAERYVADLEKTGARS